MICENCYQKVESCYQFKLLCHKTEETILKNLKKDLLNQEICFQGEGNKMLSHFEEDNFSKEESNSKSNLEPLESEVRENVTQDCESVISLRSEKKSDLEDNTDCESMTIEEPCIEHQDMDYESLNTLDENSNSNSILESDKSKSKTSETNEYESGIYLRAEIKSIVKNNDSSEIIIPKEDSKDNENSVDLVPPSTNNSNNTEKRIVCLECNINFKKPKHFFEHASLEHTDKYCILDSKELVSGSQVVRRLYYCSKCKLPIYEEDKFKNHKAMHEWTPKCDGCNDIFTNFETYQSHKNECIEMNLLREQYNAKFLHENQHLAKFFKKTKPKRRRSSKCNWLCHMCGKFIGNKNNFYGHIRSHNNQRPYACKTCGKAFNERGSLRIHCSTHIDARNFICAFCGKQFKTESSLCSHLIIHNGERKYKCTMCDSRFYLKKLLERHYVTHTNEKNFVCQVCNKTFGWKSSLDVHMKYHIQDRKYACSLCDKAFVEKAILKKHLKSKQHRAVPINNRIMNGSNLHI